MTPNRCIVVTLELRDHPSNPKFKLSNVGEHQLVLGDHYDQGVVGVYIPIGAIVPDGVLEAMWLKGKLAGKQKNRVNGRYIGGFLSDGLFYGSRYFAKSEGGSIVYFDSPHWNPKWAVGDDVTEELGITFKEAS